MGDETQSGVLVTVSALLEVDVSPKVLLNEAVLAHLGLGEDDGDERHGEGGGDHQVGRLDPRPGLGLVHLGLGDAVGDRLHRREVFVVHQDPPESGV